VLVWLRRFYQGSWSALRTSGTSPQIPYRVRMAADAQALALPDASTLQALTEEAVAHREERPLLAAELVVPSIQLAQQVALQLDAYGLGDKTLFGYNANAHEFSPQDRLQFRGMIWEDVDAALGRRRYTLQCARWHTGHWWHREQHSAPVLVLEKTLLDRRPLWDPRTPGTIWDLENPPQLDGGLGLKHHSWCDVQLPTSEMLAFFAFDARQLVDGIVAREIRSTEHLDAGLEHADAALAALAV